MFILQYNIDCTSQRSYLFYTFTLLINVNLNWTQTHINWGVTVLMIKRFALTHIKPVLFSIYITHFFCSCIFNVLWKYIGQSNFFEICDIFFYFSLYLFIIYVYTYMNLYVKIYINISILQNIRCRQNNMYDKLFFYYQNQIH